LHPSREFVHGLTLDWDVLNLLLGSGGGNWQEVQETGRWLFCPVTHFLVSRAANQLLSFPYEEDLLDCPFAAAFRNTLQRVQRGSRKSGGCERGQKAGWAIRNQRGLTRRAELGVQEGIPAAVFRQRAGVGALGIRADRIPRQLRSSAKTGERGKGVRSDALSPKHGIGNVFGVARRRRLYLLLAARSCRNGIISGAIGDALESVGNARQLEGHLVGPGRSFQHDDAFSAEVESSPEQQASHDGDEHHEHVMTGDGEASAGDGDQVV
jgi:hypothetical protein